MGSFYFSLLHCTLYTVLIIQDFKLEMWFTALCLYIFCISISHQQDARSSSYYKKLNKILKSKTTSTIPLKESSLQCLGKQNVFTSADRRACLFRNLCYKKSSKEFLFIQLADISEGRPVWWDKKHGPLLDFNGLFCTNV